MIYLFTIMLLWLSVIDFHTQCLPDYLTLSLLWLGLLINTQALFVPLNEAVIGAALGYVILRCIAGVFFRVTKKIGMGGGDFKLLAALGAWVGWAPLPQIVAIASLCGIVTFILLKIVSNKTQKNTRIAFGPFLALSGWISLCFGNI